ncbi:MAG TPA: hypothetical protein VE974_23760 [Thermoanaerobaculia bacterium]|nr:hypothetical protein [Thermoanaerobaculia bacterium]
MTFVHALFSLPQRLILAARGLTPSLQRVMMPAHRLIFSVHAVI